MDQNPKRLPVIRLAVLATSLMLAGCGSVNMPSFGTSPEPQPPPPTASSLPSKYTPDEFVGRWGFTSYQKEADRARTVNTARSLCRSPYVITKGPTGGVMMHLADERQASELRLKASADGRNYIGPDGDAGVAQDREILSFDGRVLITRYVDPDAANRYGNMVYVRCAARG
jgi:hypothetical protein